MDLQWEQPHWRKNSASHITAAQTHFDFRPLICLLLGFFLLLPLVNYVWRPWVLCWALCDVVQMFLTNNSNTSHTRTTKNSVYVWLQKCHRGGVVIRRRRTAFKHTCWQLRNRELLLGSIVLSPRSKWQTSRSAGGIKGIWLSLQIFG